MKLKDRVCAFLFPEIWDAAHLSPHFQADNERLAEAASDLAFKIRTLEAKLARVEQEARPRTTTSVVPFANRTPCLRCEELKVEREHIINRAAAAMAELQQRELDVGRRLDAVIFGLERRLEIALSLLSEEQRTIYDGEIIEKGGAGQPSAAPPGSVAYNRLLKEVQEKRNGRT